MHLYEWLAFIFICMLISGCTQREEESLINGINHRYQYDEIRSENGPLYRSLSLTGLLPTQKLGVPYYFSSQEGIDASFEIGREKTLYATQTIGDNVKISDVQDVSQKILALRQMSNKVLHAKLNLIKAQKEKDAALTSSCLTAYQNAQGDFDKAYGAVTAALKPGIVILQWGESNKNKDAVGKLFQYNRNDAFKGLLVLGGVKISKLLMGKDFLDRLAPLAHKKKFCWENDHLIIPTYLLQTRHLIFVDQLNDIESDSFAVNLEEALKSNDLSALDKIEIDAIHKETYSLFGLGQISGVKTSYEPNPECGDFNARNPWITVYAILPTVQNLYSKLNACYPKAHAFP